MATRNFSTNTASRQSMASSGGAVKARQLVRFYFFVASSAADSASIYEFPASLERLPRLAAKVQVTGANIHPCFQAQLQAQLARLSANLADTENLLRMTSVQAESMRGLGSWHAGL
jgi:hypothetical protein